MSLLEFNHSSSLGKSLCKNTFTPQYSLAICTEGSFCQVNLFTKLSKEALDFTGIGYTFIYIYSWDFQKVFLKVMNSLEKSQNIRSVFEKSKIIYSSAFCKQLFNPSINLFDFFRIFDH